MKSISRSGNLVYVCDSTDVIPSIRDLIKSPQECSLFVNSATINPKDVNANLYAQFNADTYSAFIYAFAIQLGEIRSARYCVHQIEMNARRVERLCKRREINLSETELTVIDTCKNFYSLKCRYKEQSPWPAR